MTGVAALSAMTMAQSVTTHSVYDVNQNGEINVADAASVAQATLQELDPEQTQQYVTAEDLSTMFSTILTKLESLEARLAALENKKCDCGGSEGNVNMDNGHEYVDLGVVVDGNPVYWAATNIGAEQPADYGLYFAWGETVGYGSYPRGEETVNDWDGVVFSILDGHSFDWSSYSLWDRDPGSIKKYSTMSKFGLVDNKTVLEPEDDAAHVNWQGSWRMPTEDEQDALRTQCTWTWTTMTNSEGESINGYKVSNKTDSSKFIFLPAAGYREDTLCFGVGSRGLFWSSSLCTNGCDDAHYLSFDSDSYSRGGHDRHHGHTVRPVRQ